MGSDGSAAGGGVKRPERVAAVGEGRRRSVTEDIRRITATGVTITTRVRNALTAEALGKLKFDYPAKI